MTKYEWENIKRWFSNHNNYWFGVLLLGFLAILGQLIMLDALYDGGSMYDPGAFEMPFSADDSIGAVWDGKVIGDKYPSWNWAIFGMALTAPFAIWIWYLPVNTLLLKIRRRDFFTGEKRPSKRELKVKDREREANEAITAIRRRENELELEPYEFGNLSR